MCVCSAGLFQARMGDAAYKGLASPEALVPLIRYGRSATKRKFNGNVKVPISSFNRRGRGPFPLSLILTLPFNVNI
jgi:hypothetical protein